MKALTVRQPWATALVSGWKTIETRSWRTKYRGRLAIHAGARCASDQTGTYPRDLTVSRDRAGLLLRSPGLSWPHRLPLGAIIGTVDIVDCVPVQDIIEPWTCGAQELEWGDWSPAGWAWICRNPTRFRRPISAVGRLGLWTCGEEIPR